jgi:hypothetical protein
VQQQDAASGGSSAEPAGAGLRIMVVHLPQEQQEASKTGHACEALFTCNTAACMCMCWCCQGTHGMQHILSIQGMMPKMCFKLKTHMYKE